MIEIKVPKEITEYKEKFLFGLTIRQCVSAVVALAICVPLYIFGKDYLGDDLVGWLVILIAVPIFGFGFFKYDGMPFEIFIAMLYLHKCWCFIFLLFWSCHMVAFIYTDILFLKNYYERNWK